MPSSFGHRFPRNPSRRASHSFTNTNGLLVRLRILRVMLTQHITCSFRSLEKAFVIKVGCSSFDDQVCMYSLEATLRYHYFAMQTCE